MSVRFLPNKFGDKKVRPTLRLKISDEVRTFKQIRSNGEWSTFGIYPNSRIHSNFMIGIDTWMRK
ncbi:hypothetical protein NMK71_07810 [Weeksellaceae bacterium KMM 9713]|uniref:Uncharacterized protein n=1 Tax=Profundicola chukchiensis TaxID=2961959 RepID=A0A9X4MZ74_9FLAO|nr:hypothetical protein [Profundicola chukchiensis]MDG4946315.1 hypothetical protein [Profundicola chukchiensis]MDG4950855.1 hypothetical protein [Profundicola chukchiensis]